MIKKTYTLSNRHITYEKSVITNLLTDIQSYVDKFKDPIEYAKKETHIEFIKYINAMIDFDKANGIELVSDDGSVKWFSFDEFKDELILFTDIIGIGGRITFESFDADQYAGISGGTSSAVSTADMTSYIIEELKNIKHEMVTKKNLAKVKPYGVNCVLASMIEHELKLHSQRKYISTVLKNAKDNIDNGTLILNSDDQDYFNDLYESIINEVLIPNSGNDIWMTGVRFKKFINDYPMLNLNYGIEEAMFNRTLTLNQLIQNSNATNDWEPDFLELMKRTFGKLNLNLRNCLAHCGYTNQNYHSPYTSFYLNEIFVIIVKDFYLK